MSTGESSSLERSPAMHELSEHELKKQKKRKCDIQRNSFPKSKLDFRLTRLKSILLMLAML
jgi:hypothetical protein